MKALTRDRIVLIGTIISILILPQFVFADQFDDTVDEGDAFFEQMIDDAPNTETPLNTNKDEIHGVRESSFEALKQGKDFFFAMHHVFESIVIALDPIGIDPLFIGIIAVGILVFFAYKFLKGRAREFAIAGLIIVGLVAFFMVLNINPQF